MILDSIDRKDTYNTAVPHFAEAMEFALSLQDKPAGRYEYDALPAGSVYAMVCEGTNRPAEGAKYEAHHRYLDVQIMLEGGETMYYADVRGLEEDTPYDEKSDILFYTGPGQPVRVLPGMFYLVFPHDGHMPSCELDGPGSFRKIVLKIHV